MSLPLHATLAKARKRLGRSQEEMAADVGVSQVTISSWESEVDGTRVSPRADRVEAIARAYQLDPEVVWALWRRSVRSRAA